MEDWYSEDLLPEDRRRHPVEGLRRWEREALREGAYATTTSQGLAEQLARAYDCAVPAVVYNSFSLAERDNIDGQTRDRVERAVPSLCWFSQIIGRGRGLETLIDALPDVQAPFEIHLRGKCEMGFRESLIARAPINWRDRIYFHPQVPHAELISRLAEHDLGYAGEVPYCRNKELTISNKVLHYLLAGIAVVASDTPGQLEVARMADGGVVTFCSGQPRDLARVLNSILADPERLRLARQHALRAAECVFCWERSAPVLLQRLVSALGKNSASIEHGASQLPA